MTWSPTLFVIPADRAVCATARWTTERIAAAAVVTHPRGLPHPVEQLHAGPDSGTPPSRAVAWPSVSDTYDLKRTSCHVGQVEKSRRAQKPIQVCRAICQPRPCLGCKNLRPAVTSVEEVGAGHRAG
jgi:hypothetical protein